MKQKQWLQIKSKKKSEHCQQLWNLRWNGHIIRKIYLTKTYSEKLNVPITVQEIAAISSHQERARLFNKQVLPTFKKQRILILHNIF